MYPRTRKSKLLNSLLIIVLILITLVSIQQIGVLIAVLLICCLSTWLVLYNFIGSNARVTADVEIEKDELNYSDS